MRMRVGDLGPQSRWVRASQRPTEYKGILDRVPALYL